MLNEKTMINTTRPFPLELNQMSSAIEIIKQTKSLAINNSSYNNYFTQYYNITEFENDNSEISKLIKSEETSTRRKNQLSSLLPLQNNNVFMEVRFSKNYQSRVNKTQLENSKISKFRHISTDTFAIRVNHSTNNSVYLQGALNDATFIKPKKLKPLQIMKASRTDEYSSSNEIILKYLFPHQDIKNKISMSEAFDAIKQDSSSKILKLIESKNPKDFEDFLSGEKVNNVQVKDYFYKYLRSKQVLIELKPFKIEFANYNENEFYKKDFYLPLDLCLAFYLGSNDVSLALLITKLFIFNTKTKGFEFSKAKLVDLKVIFDVAKQNSNVDFSGLKGKAEMLTFNWLASNVVYDVSIHYPKVILKFKEKEVRINKLLSFESFGYLYLNGFENWEYFMIHQMMEEKQFRDLFVSIVSIATENNILKDEYNIDESPKHYNLIRQFGDHSPFYFYIDTVCNVDSQINWLNLINGNSIEALDILKEVPVSGEASLSIAQSRKLREISLKWKSEDFLKRIINCKSRKVQVRQQSLPRKLEHKPKSINIANNSRNDLLNVGSVNDLRASNKIQTKLGLPGVDLKDDQEGMQINKDNEDEKEVLYDYLDFELAILDKLDFSVINFFRRLPSESHELQSNRYSIIIKNMEQHSMLLNNQNEVNVRDYIIQTELCINLLSHHVEDWKHFIPDLSRSKFNISNFKVEAGESKKQAKFLDIKINKQTKKSAE